MTVEIIQARSKHDCEHLLGKFLDDSHYDLVVENDTDFYAPPTLTDERSEANIMFKFRKNVFTAKEMEDCYNGLIGAAQETHNRGLAAGPRGEKEGNRDWVTDCQLELLDHFMSGGGSLFSDEDPVQEILDRWEGDNSVPTRGMVWLRNKIKDDPDFEYEGFFDKILAKLRAMNPEDANVYATKIASEYISETSYAQAVNSGIAGFFDRYPRIPYCRPTAFTEQNPEKFKMAFPFLNKLDSYFKDLLPQRYASQREHADRLDPKFLISDTVFTTATVNKTFRTAAHRDAGDLSSGFSNLCCITNGKDFKGGYLVLPEFRVAINIRPGDLLLINNHEGIHGNTEIVGDEGFERMSIVCYFREKMLESGSFEYEQLRKQFVYARKNNPEHSDWRPLWNGISPSMWESQEWDDYLVQYGFPPDNERSSLESFFG